MRKKMIEEIKVTCKEEVHRKNTDGESIYSKDEIKEIFSRIKSYLAPEKILTSQHLQSLLQIVRHLMVLENIQRRIASFFPKLIINLNSSRVETHLKLKFLTSLRRVQVALENQRKKLYLKISFLETLC